MTRRICVVGSSYIGAVYKAYQERSSPSLDYRFDFYGRGAGRFRELRIADGQVRNARFASVDPAPPVADYDAFIFYGDLPSPHDLARVLNECRRASASSQLVKSLVKDIARATTVHRLARSLGRGNCKPVLLLSANIAAPPKVALDERGYDQIVSLLRKAVSPYQYLPFPRELFTSEFRPDAKFYQGSLDITGDPAGNTARRDRYHMNALGGRLVLDAMIGALNDALSAQRTAADGD